MDCHIFIIADKRYHIRTQHHILQKLDGIFAAVYGVADNIERVAVIEIYFLSKLIYCSYSPCISEIQYVFAMIVSSPYF